MAVSSPGHIELERSLDSITIGTRHRTDLGDIDALADSIRREGLLQPITVTPDGSLVCGRRRLEALRRLGYRSTNVWVRSNLSDRLSRLLAEQNDNALHKPLSLIEAESLYRELRVVLAEDAARRQAATRFGAAGTAGGDRAEVSGGAESAPPSGENGKARTQAAQLVTGKKSYSMLEELGRLKDLANDERHPAHIRAQAADEIKAIEAGGKVHGAHLRMNTALSLDELDRIATDHSQPALVRAQAEASANEVRSAAAQDARTAELAALAADAIARVTAEKRSKAKKQKQAPARPALTLVVLPPRAFVALWADMDGWTKKYDVDNLASTLSHGEWERAEAVLAETVAFFALIRTARSPALPETETFAM